MSDVQRPVPTILNGSWIPKSTLTVLNEQFEGLTGRKMFLRRSFSVITRKYTYLFSDGTVRATYVGALLHMRIELSAAMARKDRD